MSALYGFGLGVVSTNAQGATLDAFYPRPLTHVNGDVAGVWKGWRASWMCAAKSVGKGACTGR
ncbi:MAG: hypothetical protein CM15mP74_21910 [Halieaceae bacterium]|nr:MAG: hypothetical protein CM15mP74_21910 [Halieaceae bacterium]